MAADLEYYGKYTGKDYTERQQQTLTLLLEEAEEAILAFTKGKWETASGKTTPIDNIQCRIVYRIFENPDGITGETVDGYNYQRGIVSTSIELTDKEMQALTKYGITTNKGRFGSISVSRGGGTLW